MGALDGISVLDLTRLLPGGAATAALRAEGAAVIKIEEPITGDYARGMPPLIDGVGAVFRETNGGKKSVALNLKNEQGREAFLAMARTADVVMEGFRPGVMARLGLSYEVLSRANPRLIYAAISGYGQSGEMAMKAGHDVNYLAMSGLLSVITTKSGTPVIPGVQLGDLAGGTMQAVNRILLALIERARTGRGQFLDISMTAGLSALMTIPHALYKAKSRTMRNANETLTGRYACYNVYQSRDGAWFAVGALEPKFWQALCAALDCEELCADQFAENPRQLAVIEKIAERFAARSAAEWRAFWAAKDVCVTPVLQVAETSIAVSDPVPRLGEHTREVLREFGYADERIDALAAGGAIGC
jgi:crotonobetainyl-CoA:carnitine CoA-transferase CaiB-like acyl-CoA transferase